MMRCNNSLFDMRNATVLQQRIFSLDSFLTPNKKTRSSASVFSNPHRKERKCCDGAVTVQQVLMSRSTRSTTAAFQISQLNKGMQAD